MADGKYDNTVVILYWLSICAKENAAERVSKSMNLASEKTAKYYTATCCVHNFF